MDLLSECIGCLVYRCESSQPAVTAQPDTSSCGQPPAGITRDALPGGPAKRSLCLCCHLGLTVTLAAPLPMGWGLAEICFPHSSCTNSPEACCSRFPGLSLSDRANQQCILDFLDLPHPTLLSLFLINYLPVSPCHRQYFWGEVRLMKTQQVLRSFS